MSEEVQDLEAPVLLLAMPQVQDPYFQQSVVLLIHHNEEGSFGLIANRPTDVNVPEILEGMKISWAGEASPPAFFGGPVQPQLGTVLFDQESAEIEPGEAFEQTTFEVYPGVRITQHVGDLESIASSPTRLFRLFLGYAGWGSGQLVDEILRNDWLTAPVREDLIFACEGAEAWERALRSVGVDPASLPSWTETSSEEEAN